MAEIMGPLGLPLRFESKIIPEPNTGCWLWCASLNEHGYGRVRYEGRSWRAHRAIYQIITGTLPPLLDHRCRQRCCVNPVHLRPITNAENIRLGLSGSVNGARQRAKTECPHGHLYANENLIITKEGERLCRRCTLAKHSRYRAKQRRKEVR